MNIVVNSSFLTFCRKSLFKDKINMVHLNLAIALLCGLIVFVSGVETATDNEVQLSYMQVKQIILFAFYRLLVLWSPLFYITFFWLSLLGHYVKGSAFMCCLWHCSTKAFSSECVSSCCLVGVSYDWYVRK